MKKMCHLFWLSNSRIIDVINHENAISSPISRESVPRDGACAGHWRNPAVERRGGWADIQTDLKRVARRINDIFLEKWNRRVRMVQLTGRVTLTSDRTEPVRGIGTSELPGAYFSHSGLGLLTSEIAIGKTPAQRADIDVAKDGIAYLIRFISLK